MFRPAGTKPRRRRVSHSRLTVAATVLTLLPITAYLAASHAASAAAPTPGFTATGHPNPPNDVSACATRAAGSLCVRAAEDSALPGPGLGGEGPSKNDPVSHYKWLLNQDNTGSVTLGPDGKTPIAAEVKKCHPITSTFPNGNPNYPNGPDGSPILSDGSPNPAACNWPSIHNITSSPVVSEGSQNDWGPQTPIPFFSSATGRGLKDGRYLISVTANGYQIGGAHFVVTNGHVSGLDASAAGAVVVSLNPLPIPLSNVRLKVYGDMASSNSQWDEQSEFGLPGYAGHLTDFDGPVSVDYYNNPLCTAYLLTPAYNRATHPDPTDSYYQVKLGLDGRPIIDPGRHIRGNFEVPGPATGRCTSDSNGDILLPYLAPNRYAASVIADPAAGLDPVTNRTIEPQATCPVIGVDGEADANVQKQACWVQTTTLEGNHDFDAWPQANSTGYDTELLVGGELVPEVQFGFVRAGCMANTRTGTVDFQGLTNPARWLSPSDSRCAHVPGGNGAHGEIKGRIMGANAYYPGLGALPGTAGNAGTAGYKFDRPVEHPWVTLSDLNNGDKTIWAANAELSGSFDITGVPDGSYSIAVWDQPQDYIFDSFNVTVSGGKVVDLGVVPLLDWWTRIDGKVCIDKNADGRCESGEPGVPDFTVQNLNRTNNAQEGGINVDLTDEKGNYSFKEAYPLSYDDIIQAFNTRYKTIGMTWQACNDPQEHTTLTAAVDVAYNPVISQCARLDWAVQPYAGSTAGQRDANRVVDRADNGGIVATVFNNPTRTGYLGRGQAGLDFFTGIPGVVTELFQPVKAPANAPETRSCLGNPTAPNVSYNGYLLNCDGSYKTTGADGGYRTTYSGGHILTTDRFGDLHPNPGTVNAYQTERYGRPTGCVARDANGKLISGTLGPDGKVQGTEPNGNTVTDFLPGLSTDPNSENPGHYTQACIEAPASALTFGLGSDFLPLDPNVANGDIHGTQTVDGNYALTPTDVDGNPMVGDFLAKIDIPGDKVLPQPTPGVDRPLWKVSDETDLNALAGSNLAAWTADLGTGDPNDPGHATVPQFVPQNADLQHVYNPDGSEHTDLGSSCAALDGTNGTRPCVAFSFPRQAAQPNQAPVATPVSGREGPTSVVEDPEHVGTLARRLSVPAAQYTVHVTDPGFLSQGGSPVEGYTRNTCDTYLLHVGGGQSVAPELLPVHRRADPDDVHRSELRRHQPVDQQGRDAVRRRRADPELARGPLRLARQPRVPDQHRPERHRRGAHALSGRGGLPDPGRGLPERVPVRRQRPRHDRPPQRQLQPAVPDDHRQLPGDARRLHAGRHRADAQRPGLPQRRPEVHRCCQLRSFRCRAAAVLRRPAIHRLRGRPPGQGRHQGPRLRSGTGCRSRHAVGKWQYRDGSDHELERHRGRRDDSRQHVGRQVPTRGHERFRCHDDQRHQLLRDRRPVQADGPRGRRGPAVRQRGPVEVGLDQPATVPEYPGGDRTGSRLLAAAGQRHARLHPGTQLRAAERDRRRLSGRAERAVPAEQCTVAGRLVRADHPALGRHRAGRRPGRGRPGHRELPGYRGARICVGRALLLQPDRHDGDSARPDQLGHHAAGRDRPAQRGRLAGHREHAVPEHARCGQQAGHRGPGRDRPRPERAAGLRPRLAPGARRFRGAGRDNDQHPGERQRQHRAAHRPRRRRGRHSSRRDLPERARRLDADHQQRDRRQPGFVRRDPHRQPAAR